MEAGPQDNQKEPPHSNDNLFCININNSICTFIILIPHTLWTGRGSCLAVGCVGDTDNQQAELNVQISRTVFPFLGNEEE